MEIEMIAQINAARNGSPAALGPLLEAYRPFLHMLAEKNLPADLQAKAGISDLVQETYAEAHLDFAQFQGRSEAELAGWLEQILRNNIANFVGRFRGTDKRRVDREVSLQGLAGNRIQIPAPEATPSAEAMKNETAEALTEALARLPEDYRLVIELRHQQNLTFAEVAAQMERSEAAVRKLWARALERWREEVYHEAGSTGD
jgi:RNA polymerase sigma-70 factor (ECF subfamily)